GTVPAPAGTDPSGRPAPTTRPVREPIHPVWDWLDGVAVVARVPVLRRVMGVAGCMALAQGAFVVLFVLFVVRDLGGGESEVGVLRGVQAIGALAGGGLLGLVARRTTAGRLVAGALAVFGGLSLVTWNATAVTTTFGVYVGLFIAAGLPGLASMTGLFTLLQAHSPDAYRGRVMSAFFAVYGGVQALGMLLAGLVGTGTGLTVALDAQGACYLAAAALALRLTTDRQSPGPGRSRIIMTSRRTPSGMTPTISPVGRKPARR
ncbi:MFS transporter, partial [Micromonospora zhanjiangensis]